MSASTKLLCTAAALETWPEALVPSLDPNTPDDILMQCTLAALHGVVSLVQQDTSSAKPASSAQPDLSALGGPHPGEAVTTTEERSKLALQDWGRNPFTQTAASQLNSMYAQHWQQQSQNRPVGKDAVISCPPEHADTFWSMAVPSVAANLQGLCAKGELSESCLQKQWTCLHHALELAISCLGWRWGFEQVCVRVFSQQKSSGHADANSKLDMHCLRSLQYRFCYSVDAAENCLKLDLIRGLHAQTVAL